MVYRVGGSFAPPLSDELLASYKALTDALQPSPVKDAMTALLRCCGVWWDLPEPVGTSSFAHPSGAGTVVRLEAAHAAELDQYIPWQHELSAIQKLFDEIDNESDKQLRDSAFHLLWHVKELDLGREPMTADRL
jgi:hypothetical protein